MATYEQTEYDLVSYLYNFSYQPHKYGQVLTVPSIDIVSLGFWMGKSGTVSGDVTFQVYRTSDNQLMGSKVWGDASALPNWNNDIANLEFKEVTFDTHISVVGEIRVVVYWVGGSGVNNVVVAWNTTDIVANENRCSWDPIFGWDDAESGETGYSFSTSEPSSVTTQAVTNKGAITATGNGNITSLGSPTATQHGHCWNKTGTPTIADSKTELGAPSETGAYTSNLTGLDDGTLYYVRAYITNDGDTYYGNEVTFTTGIIIPIEAISRVTSIIHRYDRNKAIYQLEANIGEVTSDFGIPEWSNEPISAVKKITVAQTPYGKLRKEVTPDGVTQSIYNNMRASSLDEAIKLYEAEVARMEQFHQKKLDNAEYYTPNMIQFSKENLERDREYLEKLKQGRITVIDPITNKIVHQGT